MQFDPLPKQTSGRVWFITEVKTNGSVTVSNLAGNTMQIPARAEYRLRSLSGTVYSLVDPSILIQAGDGPQYWKAFKYHRRKTKLAYKTDGKDPGLSVYPLAQFTNDPVGVASFFQALEELGVRFSSLSRMARDSWCRFLKETVEISSPEASRQSVTNAFTGGRRESLRDQAVYNGLAYMDIPAAYLRAMQEALPTRLVHAEPKMHYSGIAEASVYVPETIGWKPLPITKRQQGIVLSNFATGWLGGTWTFEELRLAERYGCQIQIHDAWRATDNADLFGLWLRWAYALRTLAGPAGILAKQFTTRLWALFGLNENSTRTVIGFDADGQLLPSKRLPRIPFVGDSKFLAAIIAARTRVDLWTGLSAGGVWTDTDGVIIPLDKATFLEKQGWKKKEEISVLQIENWAYTRYHCIRRSPRGLVEECAICNPPGWHYRIDGVQPDSQDALLAWRMHDPNSHWETDSQGITLASDDAERFRCSRQSILGYESLPIQRGI